MKYIDEYRDPQKVKALLAEIGKVVTKPWVLMEICGGTDACLFASWTG